MEQGRQTMKYASITMIVIALLLIVLTSPPNTRSNHESTVVVGSIHWVNPDGLGGQTAAMAVSERPIAWTNPDGTHDIAERVTEKAPKAKYAWVNPDGYKASSMTAPAADKMLMSSN
jgi:hypothetical protein